MRIIGPDEVSMRLPKSLKVVRLTINFMHAMDLVVELSLEEQHIITELIQFRGCCEFWTWEFSKGVEVDVVYSGQEYVRKDED